MTNANKTKEPKRDSQSRSWCLCFHNLESTGYDAERVMQIIKEIPSLKYCCLSVEIGVETKKKHIHSYLYCHSPIRFSTLKNKFEGADFHIEQSRGTAEQNRDYVFKIGKWEDNPDKSEQRIDGQQFEFGEIPETHQGKRTDLEKLYLLIRDGYSNAEILRLIPDIAMRNIEKIDRVRKDIYEERFANERRLDLEVNYIFGVTRMGKTRGVLDAYGDVNCCRISDYQHPFDSYDITRHQVLIFDEFRSSLKIADMLNYLDVYPILLPARYANKVAGYNKVFVISNESFESQYSEIQRLPEKAETYTAWIKRFNGYVKRYNADGTIDTWNTMQDYLNRNKDWHTPETGEDMPFN